MFEADGILMVCGGEMNKLILCFIFILCGCPKQGADNIDLIESERKEKLKELMEQEDEEFDDIAEADEDES